MITAVQGNSLPILPFSESLRGSWEKMIQVPCFVNCKKSILHLQGAVLGTLFLPHPLRDSQEPCRNRSCLSDDPRETKGWGRCQPGGSLYPCVGLGGCGLDRSLAFLDSNPCTESADLGVLCRPPSQGAVHAEPSTETQRQGTKNCHCPVINNSGEVTAQDHLSHWISNIHADKIEKNPLLFIFYSPPLCLPPALDI